MEGVLFLVKADGGLEVASEGLWRLIREYGKPAIIVLNRMNKEHANFAEAVSGMQARLEGTVVPVQLPVGEGESFRGVVDLIRQKAYVFEKDQRVETDIPGDLAAAVSEAREQLLNAARFSSKPSEKQDQVRRKNSLILLEKGPLLALAAFSCLITYFSQKSSGAVSSFTQLPLTERIPNAFLSYLLYLKKMFWPLDLAIF